MKYCKKRWGASSSDSMLRQLQAKLVVSCWVMLLICSLSGVEWYEYCSRRKCQMRFMFSSPWALMQPWQKHRSSESLSVTPRVGTIEDHVLQLLDDLPLLVFCWIEEFVEQNYQNGYKEQESAKHIRNTENRAKSKADQILVSLNSSVQKFINEMKN